jgi:lipoprotein NlpD
MHPDSPAGRWVVVGPGETLELIARRAGVPPEDILEVNGLERADQIKPGRTLFVLAPQAVPESPADNRPMPPTALATVRLGLRWPLATGSITLGSRFGRRDGRPHEGIDLPAPVGTPVFAAADGEVAYAGAGVRGYGNMLVLRHPGDLLTVYAHNSVLLVARGQPVRAGDRIALVGQSGRATGPHLHFEVRAGEIPRDPMLFLPEVPR